jgi:hypothetical protein
VPTPHHPPTIVPPEEEIAMTNPKTSESRAVASRTKPADSAAPPNADQDVMLQQLVSLANSINALVEQNAAATDPPPPPSPTPSRSPEELRVVFAYEFLGVVLGRRTPRVFQLRNVEVRRDFDGLTFTGLNGATAARIRSDRNVVVDLKDLRDGVAFPIDKAPDPQPRITSDQRIDSIIIFSAPGGVPVAIGPCLGPVFGEIADSKR